MGLEHESWRSIARALGVRAISPFDLVIDGASARFAALLPQFGGRAGMIVDPDWSNIDPHAKALIREGYGYSCLSVAGSQPPDMQDVLADWGWNGRAEERPDWLAI